MPKIAFQMEPMAEVNPLKNNSLHLMRAAQALGHTLYQYHPHELMLENERVRAHAREVTHREGEVWYELGDAQDVDLAKMDAVMIRQDPPFNMEYLTTTYILEMLPPSVKVINPPRAVRHYPEKFFPFLTKELMPETLVTYRAEAVAEFLETHGDIILKPLYLFGGNDIHRIQRNQKRELAVLIPDMVSRTRAPIMVQRFLPEVAEGDKRILLLHGEPVGEFLRVPKQGSHLANLMQGGELVASKMSARDKAVCETLKPILQREQIAICGIDIIGYYLTEVNITSPIGFKEIEELTGREVAKEFWGAIF